MTRLRMRNRNKYQKTLCLNDFELVAKSHLPKSLYAYISGGVEDNLSLKNNLSLFDELFFLPHVLCDVSKVATDVTIFGDSFSSPFGIAPMGLSALYAYQGDKVLANAALDENIPMILSGSSLIPMEKIAHNKANIWFQAYLPGSDEQILALLNRVETSGFDKLVITVDTPVAANRENNIRAGFSTPLRPNLKLLWDGLTHADWALNTFAKTIFKHGMLHFENNYASRGAPILSKHVIRDFSDRGHLTWRHIQLIRKYWQGQLILKGVLNSQDAQHAVALGIDGLIVSNHGGRQLDGAISPLYVLREIVLACPSIPVMYDSGIRRGTDVLKALALGAKCTFVGRPFAYAAAVGGQASVQHGIRLLKEEVKRDLALLGVADISSLSENYLKNPSGSILK